MLLTIKIPTISVTESVSRSFSQT